MKTKITFAQTSCAKCRTCLDYKYRDPNQKTADTTCTFCFLERLRKRTEAILQCFNDVRKITFDADREQTKTILDHKEFEDEIIICNKLAEDALKKIRNAVSRVKAK